jgi:hypothetical protein
MVFLLTWLYAAWLMSQYTVLIFLISLRFCCQHIIDPCSVGFGLVVQRLFPTPNLLLHLLVTIIICVSCGFQVIIFVTPICIRLVKDFKCSLTDSGLIWSYNIATIKVFHATPKWSIVSSIVLTFSLWSRQAHCHPILEGSALTSFLTRPSFLFFSAVWYYIQAQETSYADQPFALCKCLTCFCLANKLQLWFPQLIINHHQLSVKCKHIIFFFLAIF